MKAYKIVLEEIEVPDSAKELGENRFDTEGGIQVFLCVNEQESGVEDCLFFDETVSGTDPEDVAGCIMQELYF